MFEFQSNGNLFEEPCFDLPYAFSRVAKKNILSISGQSMARAGGTINHLSYSLEQEICG
jgi:hypothetical protein